MAWKLASQAEKVMLNVDASGDGPVNGTLTVNSVAYPVRGGWAASFSVPGRNFSAFAVAGNSPNEPQSFVAATGIMTGPGNAPTKVAIDIDLVSSADGILHHQSAVLIPA